MRDGIAQRRSTDGVGLRFYLESLTKKPKNSQQHLIGDHRTIG